MGSSTDCHLLKLYPISVAPKLTKTYFFLDSYGRLQSKIWKFMKFTTFYWEIISLELRLVLRTYISNIYKFKRSKPLSENEEL